MLEVSQFDGVSSQQSLGASLVDLKRDLVDHEGVATRGQIAPLLQGPGSGLGLGFGGCTET